jgi:hypothetical protein
MAQFDVHRNIGKHKDEIPFVHPLEIVSIPTGQLGEFLESLSHEGQKITAALDQLLSQAWN